MRLRQPAPLLQQQQRATAPLTGRDREPQFARLAPTDRSLGDDQVVQQPLRVDERCQFLDLPGRMAPHVVRRRHKARQRHRQQFLRVFHDDEFQSLKTASGSRSTRRYGGSPGHGSP